MRPFDFEVRWARVVGRTLVPIGTLGGVVDDLDPGALFRSDCMGSPRIAAIGMRAALLLVWFSPFWMSFRFRTFGGLSEAERVTRLERLLTAKAYLVRMSVLLLKITFCTLLLGDRRALKKLNAYDLGGEPPAAEGAERAS